jgi:hypothetical protein
MQSMKDTRRRILMVPEWPFRHAADQDHNMSWLHQYDSRQTTQTTMAVLGPRTPAHAPLMVVWSVEPGQPEIALYGA